MSVRFYMEQHVRVDVGVCIFCTSVCVFVYAYEEQSVCVLRQRIACTDALGVRGCVCACMGPCMYMCVCVYV